MNQLLLNIKDESKTEVLIQFLKSLNYISIETLTENGITVNETEKKIMRERVKNAKPSDFKNWDDIKNSF